MKNATSIEVSWFVHAESMFVYFSDGKWAIYHLFIINSFLLTDLLFQH